MITHLLPVRMRQDGRWRPVSARLRYTAGGLVVPAAVPSAVVLSGGGNGPLARLTSPAGGRLAVWFPARLPRPSVAGATATYHSVVPGVSLQAAVSNLGGLSETIIVSSRTPAAARLLRSLALRYAAAGLRLTADAAGNLTARSPGGTAEFSGPAPSLDASTAMPGAGSRPGSIPAAAVASRRAVDKVTRKSIAIPLAAALTAQGVTLPLRLTLAIAPDVTGIRAGPPRRTGNVVSMDVSDPVQSDQDGYVETQNGTASDGSACDKLTNWNWNDLPASSRPIGNAIATNAWGDCEGLDQSYYMFDTSALTSSMHVISATLSIRENGSANDGACSTSYPVDLYDLGDTDTVIGSNTDEANEPSLTSSEETPDSPQQVALGPNTNGCPYRTPQFDVTSDMATVAEYGDINYWNYGLQSGDKSDSLAFSRYGYNPDIQTTFDESPPAPAYSAPEPQPADYPGHPDQGCGSATPWIGATSSVQLTADFQPASGMSENVRPDWSVSPSINHPVGSYQSPGSSSLQITSPADGDTYSWQAGTTVNDNGNDNGASYTTWGPACQFTLDLTPPDVPAVTSSAFPPSGSPGTNPVQGTSGTFSFSATDPPPGTCTTPEPAGSATCGTSGVYEFVYSLNQPLPSTLPGTLGCSGSGPYAIAATTNASTGVATATSCGTTAANWGTNVLYVEAVDAAGNVSQSNEYDFYVTWNKGSSVTPGDINGDGIPDLLATTTSGSLLLYPGGSDPAQAPVTASTAADSPQPGTGWNQFQITHRGSWTPGQQVDDLFALKGSDLYRYVQNTETGQSPQFENESDIRLMDFPTCTPGADPDNSANCTGYPSSPSACPSGSSGWGCTGQILAPGDAWAGAPSGTGITNDTGYPSLLAVDPANGTLWLFQGRSDGQLQNPVQLGSSGWSGMTIVAPGAVAGQNTLWARDNSTGSLYSYPLTVDPASGIPTLNPASPGTPVPAEGTGTQITGISLPRSSYPTVTSPGQLAGGTCTTAGSLACPGLYAEDTSGNIWYYPGQPTTGGAAAALTGSSHLVGGLDSGEQLSWSLADGTGTTAADLSGNGNTGTLSPGASWAADPARGTVAQFNGTSGSVTASSAVLAIRAGQSWSVSAWVDPAVTDQYQDAVSQDGTEDSGFHLDMTSGGYWGFRRPLTDTTSPATAQATSAAPAQTGTWTFLTATFNGTTGQMNLYVNGQLSGTASDPTPFSTSGPTAVGRGLYGGVNQNWWNGSISDAQGFNYQLTASQVTALYNGNGQAGITQLS
jgi:hypothetical protein